MAASTVTITVADISQTWFDGKMFNAVFTGTIAANPATYVTGGIVCSFSHPLIKAQRPPKMVQVTSANGWIYTYIPGTTVSNGLLKIFTALGTELGNGAAIPAGNSGDTLTFEAIWQGMN